MSKFQTPGQKRRRAEALDQEALDRKRYAKFGGLSERELMDRILQLEEWTARTNNSRERMIEEIESLRDENNRLRRQLRNKET